jgi:hypothetical protein
MEGLRKTAKHVMIDDTTTGTVAECLQNLSRERYRYTNKLGRLFELVRVRVDKLEAKAS